MFAVRHRIVIISTAQIVVQCSANAVPNAVVKHPQMKTIVTIADRKLNNFIGFANKFGKADFLYQPFCRSFVQLTEITTEVLI